MQLPAMRFVRLILSLLSVLAASASELKVASLHPLLGDLARQVGGDRVQVVDLLGRNSDPHHFEPTPQALIDAGDVDLYLASGMGLESYLPTLEAIVRPPTELVVLGESIPEMEGACDHPGHDHHDHGADPHWWHSVDAFRRATSLTAAAFSKADPDGAATYRRNALEYRRKLDELERWTRREIARIPPERRVLATAHDAFAYFCRDFGFRALPVSGINREQMPDARTLSRLIASLRDGKVPAIFPEKASNPKTLAALTEETGIALAAPLNADGSTAESYEEMVRGNVSTIVAALR